MRKGFSFFLKSLSQWGRSLFLCLLCLALALGCNRDLGTVSTPRTRTDSDRITLGTTLKPRTLDPADSYELAGMIVIYNLGDTLYTYELGTTRLKPQLAREMPQISQDGLTYRIPLRQGVTFHDGTAFNAEAMVFSLKRFIENGGEPSFLLSDTIEKLQATGKDELTITLKKPFAAFPALLAFPGASAVSPSAYEIGQGKFKPDQFVGTGPYKLGQFSSDALRLERFEDYWGEKAKNSGVDLQIYPSNPANLFNAFRTGAVDVAYQSLLPQQIKKLQTQEKTGKWQVIAAPSSAVYFMTLNIKSEPMRQLKVRQAIASLVDRQLLNERVLQGQGEPLYSMIPKTFDVYQPVFQEVYGDGNVEKAQQLLSEAGYSAENPVQVEVWHSSGSITASMVAAVLKALSERDLAGAIQFEPNSIASAAFFKNIGQGLYETAMSNWYADFLDADNYIYPFLSCAKGSDATGCEEGGAQSQGSFYYSDRMNQLIDQQRQESEPLARKAIFGEIQTILAENVPYIPLWQSKDYAFAQKGIDGVTINPSQTFPFWTIHQNP